MEQGPWKAREEVLLSENQHLKDMHKQRVRNVVEIHKRNSQNFGRNIVMVV